MNRIECIMRGIVINSDDVESIENVGNYSECNRYCNDRQECHIWTYIEGSCYVKNENTFRTLASKKHVGGIKDCPTGTYTIRYSTKC